MPLQILKTALASRTARQWATNGVVRTLNLDNSLDAANDDQGNLISRVINPVRRAAGWLWGGLQWTSIRVTNIFGWLFSGLTRLSTFNWNGTDEHLQELQRGQNLTLSAVWGSFVGQGLGWLAGIGVGYGIGFLCPVIGGAGLARSLAFSVTDEAAEELRFGLRAALVQTAETLSNNLLISGYLQYRRLLKTAPRALLERVYGAETADFIQSQWGAAGQPSLSFAEVIEERVESIDNDAVRVFVENALEEGWDSFMEAGFIIAYELDTAFSQAKQSQAAALGKQRTVILNPDARTDETVMVSGQQALAKQSIESTLNTFRFIHNRDVGQIVGQPVNDYLRAQPQRRKLTIVFRHRQQPPWVDTDGQIRQASYAVPDVKAGLSWRALKAAAKPYLWGEYRATANLDNGRQMAVYGASEQEAENTLMRLLTLSTAELVTLSVSQEKIRHPNLRKRPMMVYPAFAYLLVRRPSIDLQGRTDLQGNVYDSEKVRIDLWPQEEPPNVPILQ